MSNPTNTDDHLLDHDYDGIREYDNPLPRWWVWIFYATIAFSIIYYFDFTGAIRGPGRIKEYEIAMADAARRYPQPSAGGDAASLAALRNDEKALAMGKTTFVTNCAACHRPDGGGLIGPNLTDDFWLHGGTLGEIHTTITNGVLEKGMPPWGKMLKPDQINAVAVYVASLHGTNPPNPKAPQGVKAQ